MALDLTSYTLTDSTSVRRVSQVRGDTADDGTLRLLDFGDAALYDISCSVEALTGTERDVLCDLLDSNDTEDILIDVGTRQYTGKLMPSTPVAWNNNGGRFSVTWRMRGSVV